jgi:hypothetical protein
MHIAFIYLGTEMYNKVDASMFTTIATAVWTCCKVALDYLHLLATLVVAVLPSVAAAVC